MHVDTLDVHLAVGEFIIVKEDSVSGSPTVVGRIIDIAGSMNNTPTHEVNPAFCNQLMERHVTNACLVELWPPVSNQNSSGFQRLDAVDQYNVRGITEVFRSVRSLWMKGDEISNIAFVFLHTDLKNDTYPSLNGANNFFFCRYYGDAQLNYFPLQLLIPFASENNYTHRIWSSLTYLKALFANKFFRPSQTQGNQSYFNMYLPHETWSHLLRCLKGRPGVHEDDDRSFIIIRSQVKKICRRRVAHDFTQKKVRLESKIDTIEVKTAEGLRYLNELFGSNFGMGLRKKFPSIQERTSNIQHGDIINIVDFQQEGDGIKLRFDCVISSLHVRIHYSNYSVSINSSHLPQLSLLPQIERSPVDQGVDNIVGTDFMYENILYRVRNVRGNIVTANDVDNILNEIELSRNEVDELIDEYL